MKLIGQETRPPPSGRGDNITDLVSLRAAQTQVSKGAVPSASNSPYPGRRVGKEMVILQGGKLMARYRHNNPRFGARSSLPDLLPAPVRPCHHPRDPGRCYWGGVPLAVVFTLSIATTIPVPSMLNLGVQCPYG